MWVHSKVLSQSVITIITVCWPPSRKVEFQSPVKQNSLKLIFQRQNIYIPFYIPCGNFCPKPVSRSTHYSPFERKSSHTHLSGPPKQQLIDFPRQTNLHLKLWKPCSSISLDLLAELPVSVLLEWRNHSLHNFFNHLKIKTTYKRNFTSIVEHNFVRNKTHKIILTKIVNRVVIIIIIWRVTRIALVYVVTFRLQNMILLELLFRSTRKWISKVPDKLMK